MAIVTTPLDLLFPALFVDLPEVAGRGRLLLKLEGYNVTGSVKIKPALFMLADLERRGLLAPGATVVESSSGNLGVALALVCALHGYRFICVTDPNIAPANRRGIEAYGGEVVVVDRRDAQGGYLGSRIAYIEDLLARNPGHVWLNQYANPANPQAHAEWTALEILGEVPHVTHLYVGAGTTGTLTGLTRRFAELSPATRVVAVEPEGSVTFDPDRRGRRLIPGIGASRRPEIADPAGLDKVVYVAEADAIRMCHALSRRHGLLLGGSSGSVLAAVAADAAGFAADATVVALSPDLGDKYLDTVYAPDWVRAQYGFDPTLPGAQAGPPPRREPLQAVIARHAPRPVGVAPALRRAGA
ncbi:N-(2-amino-2-carboxyethyl)-L-glutamate synthase [Methylobacterium crusticola]|uniref:N-(2-amino-2-carboxyethyl)-L-glutamate synthase n=1 Tax=Methylobacterium crusticola TaxID=1697972 RepID=A0ABQ4R1T0_9HYPH|nr:2,3-diaminopropionate biosynthesis protein SbnA [Methylobacterium crusticola]GJD51392.1 N-(2-amino-2-carboxyethyl)-L-glutamate synthase [Methylobacterium crusticola]